MSLFARSRPIFFQACFGRSSAKPHVCVTRCFMDGDFSAEDFLVNFLLVFFILSCCISVNSN